MPAEEKLRIVIVSDLQADPAKDPFSGRVLKRFPDPANFDWSFNHPMNICLRFYMVDDVTQNRLNKAWKAQLHDVNLAFYPPGHTVDPSDFTKQ